MAAHKERRARERREQAIERQAAHDALSDEEKLAKAEGRGGAKEASRLRRRITKRRRRKDR